MKVMRQLALTVVVTLSLAGYAWASSPTEQLRAYTDQVMKALENPTLTASARLEAVRALPASKGFAVGRTVFEQPFLQGQPAVAADRFEQLVEAWLGVQTPGPEQASWQSDVQARLLGQAAAHVKTQAG